MEQVIKVQSWWWTIALVCFNLVLVGLNVAAGLYWSRHPLFNFDVAIFCFCVTIGLIVSRIRLGKAQKELQAVLRQNAQG